MRYILLMFFLIIAGCDNSPKTVYVQDAYFQDQTREQYCRSIGLYKDPMSNNCTSYAAAYGLVIGTAAYLASMNSYYDRNPTYVVYKNVTYVQGTPVKEYVKPKSESEYKSKLKESNKTLEVKKKEYVAKNGPIPKPKMTFDKPKTEPSKPKMTFDKPKTEPAKQKMTFDKPKTEPAKPKMTFDKPKPKMSFSKSSSSSSYKSSSSSSKKR
jgi:hypothetical protein